jgi:hypothetical protein
MEEDKIKNQKFYSEGEQMDKFHCQGSTVCP